MNSVMEREASSLDVGQAHKLFSAECFNRAWGLIDKIARTKEDEQQMILLAHASLWHWTQRPDCTAKNRSISYWQLSRVYALLMEPANSRRYADLCLEVTPMTDAFCLGYAYEALSRAEFVAGNADQATRFLIDARNHAESVTSDEDRQLLIDDLTELERLLNPRQ